MSLLCFTANQAFSAPAVSNKQNNQRRGFENKQIKLVVIPRTQQQMSAFYEGRGFPAEAINEINKACFFTVGIRNKTSSILWLDTSNWEFQHAQAELKRITRADWKAIWQQKAIALRHQSTFRWTLIPAQLGFQPDEREGGNITLPRTDKIFSLTASFATGEQKQGKPIKLKIDNLQCAK